MPRRCSRGRPSPSSLGRPPGVRDRANGRGAKALNRMVAMATKRTRTPMSAEHKAALAEGRNQGRSVRRYLEALDAHRPKRGRKRTPDSMRKRLATIEAQMADVDALTRLQLVQER